MKYLIIILLLAFLAYALYYFIFRKKDKTIRQDSGLSQETSEAKVQSQLLKKEVKEEASDLRDVAEEKTDAAPKQSSLLREDLAEEVAKTRTDRTVFEEVKHGLQDSADDMLIKPELFDEGLAEKAAAVKAETDALTDKVEDKITLQFGNTLMQNEPIKEESIEAETKTTVEEKLEDLEAQSSQLREDLAEKILEEREDIAARIEEQKTETETPVEVKDTILDLSNVTEAVADNKSFDVLQHFGEAQANLMKDDIDEIVKEKVVVKKFVRKDHE